MFSGSFCSADYFAGSADSADSADCFAGSADSSSGYSF